MTPSRGTPESSESEAATSNDAGSSGSSAATANTVTQSASQEALDWEQDAQAAQADLSLPMAILFALVGGFILNFMPCVLPVVGLKIMAFAEQAGESRARVLWLNLWYTLGMLSVFWILAAVAIIFSRTVEGTFSWVSSSRTSSFDLA